MESLSVTAKEENSLISSTELWRIEESLYGYPYLQVSILSILDIIRSTVEAAFKHREEYEGEDFQDWYGQMSHCIAQHWYSKFNVEVWGCE